MPDELATYEQESQRREFENLLAEARKINGALKRRRAFANKGNGGIGYWAEVSGKKDNWSTEAAPGNAYLYLWHRLPRGFIGKDAKLPKEIRQQTGLFAVTQENTGGEPLTWGGAQALLTFLAHLCGNRDADVAAIRDFMYGIGAIRGEYGYKSPKEYEEMAQQHYELTRAEKERATLRREA